MKGDYRTGGAGTIGPIMWTESKGEEGKSQAWGCHAKLGKHTLWRLLYCSGDMVHVDEYVQGQDNCKCQRCSVNYVKLLFFSYC